MKKLVSSAVLAACLLLRPAVLFAVDPEDHNNFFEKNSVRDVFGDQINMGDAPEVEYFPRRPTPIPDDEPQMQRGMYPPNGQGQGMQQPPQATPSVAPLMTTVRKQQGKDPVADDLVAKFGDPRKDAQVPVATHAPVPFKGLVAALEANREDIAMLYARQYVRHFKNIQKRTEKVLDYTQAGMFAEKKSRELAEENPQPAEEEILNDPQELQEREMTEAEKNLQIDAEALSLIEQARAIRQRRAPNNKKTEANSAESLINGQAE